MWHRTGIGPWCVDPPAGGGGGNGGGGSGSGATSTFDATQLVNSLVARYGSAESAVRELARENRELRRWRRSVRGDPASLVAELKDGRELISKEEAAELRAYRALGKPDEVKARVEKASSLEAQVEKAAKRQRAADAAAAAGFKNVDILADLAESKGIHIELRDEIVDGKPVKKALARAASESGGTLVPLADYMRQHHAAYLPALTAGADGGGQGVGGVEMVPQNGTSTPPQGGSGDTVSRFLQREEERRKARPNPLAPKE